MLPLVVAAVVGISEIAELLGVTSQRAGQIARDYADFPTPIATLAAGRVWDRQAIEAWIGTHPHRRGGRPRRQRTEGESG
jgi:predicted DNA-binding transcriptional regulator AlpA